MNCVGNVKSLVVIRGRKYKTMKSEAQYIHVRKRPSYGLSLEGFTFSRGITGYRCNQYN